MRVQHVVFYIGCDIIPFLFICFIMIGYTQLFQSKIFVDLPKILIRPSRIMHAFDQESQDLATIH